MEKIELDAIAAEDRQSLINEGIAFMRTILNTFGDERGSEIWRAMSAVIDPVFEQEVFMSMLSGNLGLVVEFTVVGTAPKDGSDPQWRTNQVAVIKAIRRATGLGLYESKNLWDESKKRWTRIKALDPTRRREFFDEMRVYGVAVR